MSNTVEHENSMPEFTPYDKFIVPVNKDTGWNHIYKSTNLNLAYHNSIESDRELLAFKYMPASRIISFVKKNQFCFVSPIKWRDPYEYLFYQKDGACINDDTIDVKCACFAVNDFENEEGLWHFSPFSTNTNNDPTVRVAFKMFEFYKVLDDYATKKGNMNFYISMVNYVPSSEILSQCKNYNPSSLQEYIKKLCLKRDAYKHEIELRVFMVTSKYETENKKEDLSFIDIPNITSLIESVTLPPCDPIVNHQHYCPLCYHNVLLESNKLTREELKKLNLNVNYSGLYDIYTKLK